MLRAVASTLLLILLAPLALPAVTTTGSNVPVCCRANGAHHCTASVQPADGDAFGVQNRCPYAHPVVLPHPAQPRAHSAIPSIEEAHPFLQEFVPAIQAATADDGHTDRGPPEVSR